MNIHELDTYDLGDAVKFNNELNPRIWGADEKMRPEVRDQLLRIADDFREFLGIDVEVKDITVSGSNAAYTYTPYSDIDLHLVVDLPEADRNQVYRELFDAKKYAYNDQHDIRIGGSDVELYVQDANKTHHSQGIYSIMDNDWISVPKRRRPDVDDISVKSKFEDLGHRIEAAIASKDYEKISAMAEKIKDYRQAGLDAHGEFGPENLAFKILRTQGLIKKLYDARNQAKDRLLSLDERRRKKKKKTVRYGYGAYWYPGTAYAGQDHPAGTEGGDGGGDGGGESLNEVSMTPDGTNPSTTMVVSDVDRTPTDEDILRDFVDFCVKELKIEHMPRVKLRRDPQWPAVHKTFGRYNDEAKTLEVAWGQRHIMDVLRTVAHELTHKHQHEREGIKMGPDAGETGSPYENEANARAGVLMRDYGRLHPEYFAHGQTSNLQGVEEDIKGQAAALAAAACLAGTPGCSSTGQVIKTTQDVGRTAHSVSKMTRAGVQDEMSQELRNFIRAQGGDPNAQNLSTLYRWQKRMEQSKPTAPQQNESASGYIPTKAQARDPRYSMALTVDIKPGQVGKEANKLKLKTDRQGHPQIARANGLFENLYKEYKRYKAKEDYSPDSPPGPEFRPTMPAGTLRVDVSDVYDWYKLGQHISNLKGLGQHDFGKGPPSSIISFGDEDTEHEFIGDIQATGLNVTDIDPRDPKKRPGRKIKTDPTYNVDEAIQAPVSKEQRAAEDYYRFIVGKIKLGRMLNRQEQEFFKTYNLKKKLAEFAPSADRGDDGQGPDYLTQLANRWWNAADPQDQQRIADVIRTFGYEITQVESEDDAVQLTDIRGKADPIFISADEFDPDLYETEQNFAIASQPIPGDKFKLTINNRPFVLTPGGFGKQHSQVFLDSFYLTDMKSGKTEFVDSWYNWPLAKAIADHLDQNHADALVRIGKADFAWHEKNNDWDSQPPRLQGIRRQTSVGIHAKDFVKSVDAVKRVTGQDLDEGTLPSHISIQKGEPMELYPGSFRVVAIDNDQDRKVGQLIVYPRDGQWIGEHMVVSQEYRRQGVGTAMWNFAEKTVGGPVITMNLTADGKKFQRARKQAVAEDKMSQINLDQKLARTPPAWQRFVKGLPPQLAQEFVDERPQPNQEDIAYFTPLSLTSHEPVYVKIADLLRHPENQGNISRSPDDVIDAVNQRWETKIPSGKKYDANPGRYRQYSQMRAPMASPSVMVDGVIILGVGRFVAAALRGDDTMRVWSMTRKQTVKEEEDLDEVKMSPGALEKFATSPEAKGIRAGFEAELIFRDTQGESEELDPEPNYDADERCYSIQQVIEFFENDEYGYGLSDRQRNRLENDLDERYMEWRDEQIISDFRNDAEDLIRDILLEETPMDQRIHFYLTDSLQMSDEEADAVVKAGADAPRFTNSTAQKDYADENPEYKAYLEAADEAEQELEESVEFSVNRQDEYWDEALDKYRDDYSGDDDSFFSDVGLRWMSDVANEFNLDWPVWDGGGQQNHGSRGWEDIGNSLQDVVDMPVVVSSNYHTTKRRPGQWIIEPDGSLDPDDKSEEAGLEIVSPPMPLLTAIEKLRAVTDWANDPNGGNAYTNSSTGLHMGVSLPTMKSEDVQDDIGIDYVKLILFLGDKYVQQQFGREANTYCASALEKLKQNIKGKKSDPAGVVKLLQHGLTELAYKELQKGVGTSKYTSAHIQPGYIEFRSPGGDWLAKADEEIGVLENTMLRFARAMAIAGDPNAERQEYAKKLYKLVTADNPEYADQLRLFSEFSAGTINKEQLKKQWADTVLQKELPSVGKDEYEVYRRDNKDSPDATVGTLYARDYDDAYDQFLRQYGRDINNLDVRIKQPWFDVFDDKGKIVATIRAKDIDKATDRTQYEVGERWTDGWKIYRRPDDTPEPKASPRAQVAKRIAQPKPKAVGDDDASDWEAVYKPTGRVFDTLAHADTAQALAWRDMVMRSHGFTNVSDILVRRVGHKQAVDARTDSADLQRSLGVRDIETDVAQNFEPRRMNYELVSDEDPDRVIHRMPNATADEVRAWIAQQEQGGMPAGFLRTRIVAEAIDPISGAGAVPPRRDPKNTGKKTVEPVEKTFKQPVKSGLYKSAIGQAISQRDLENMTSQIQMARKLGDSVMEMEDTPPEVLKALDQAAQKNGYRNWADVKANPRSESAVMTVAKLANTILRTTMPHHEKIFYKSKTDENFADGKVSGKSRPGRVKRAGASCAGSVTDLRARAKKYGGEKGRMYHWCANMKAGKKK